jgi:hypothetical protein
MEFMVPLLWLVLGLLVSTGTSMSWRDMNGAALLNDNFAKVYQWNGPKAMNFSAIGDVMNEYSAQMACPVIFVRDNCFSHNPQRAKRLIRRYWPVRNTAAGNNIVKSLNKLRNQRVLFVGDSTMAAAFTSFSCYFTPVSNATFQSLWLLPNDVLVDDKQNQTRCPRDPDCYLLHSYVVFADYNLTIRYQQLNTYTALQRRTIRDWVSAPGYVQTIVILNMGVHYNNYKHFLRDMETLKGDIADWGEQQRRQYGTLEPISRIYWMESFPQHFSNGYFDDDVDRVNFNPARAPRAQGGLWCSPPKVSFAVYARERDWRNRLAEKVLENQRMIRIALPLYSQWDAHVDYGDSLRVNSTHKDCTHYCLGSGVFRLVVHEILSTIAP